MVALCESPPLPNTAADFLSALRVSRLLNHEQWSAVETATSRQTRPIRAPRGGIFWSARVC